MLRTSVGWEAVCERCGEVFMPMDETDTIHLERLDGEECGGLDADLVRAYLGADLCMSDRNGDDHQDGCAFVEEGRACTCVTEEAS